MKADRILIKIAIWIPVIVMAVIIFGFSKQNGEKSGGLSRKAAIIILDTADRCNIVKVTEDNKETYIENLQFPIRKGAHMSEYAVFGMLCLMALTVDGVKRMLNYYSAIIITALFAASDEIHQLFVPGRAGKLTDVLIDTTGCLIGLVVVYLIIHIKNKVANTKKM